MHRIPEDRLDELILDLVSLPSRQIAISFSGGETSAYMTWLLLQMLPPLGFEAVVIFANTGQENEQTLEFVRDCDRHLGFNTVWIEAVINPKMRARSDCKVVSFETASRSGEPFREMIAKYGIPNMDFPHCSRVLKKQAIRAYFRNLGWKKYYTAIGIRADEFDRMSADAEKERLIYPFVPLGVAKPDVNLFWFEQAFRLMLKGYQGNCKWCWKKSLRKLITIMIEAPEAFSFPEEMERLFGSFRPESQANRPLPANFFRDERTVAEIRELARLALERGFNPAEDDSLRLPEAGLLDTQAGCAESCEAF